MPELPEVQTIVNTLRPTLEGATIVAADLRRSDVLTPVDFPFAKQVAGQQIRSITRRAKRIVFTLADDSQFYIHLGMTGRLLVMEDPSEPLAKHTHLVLDTSAGQMRFSDPRRFGGIFWISESDQAVLGPEPLTMRAATLRKQLSRTKRPIKNALLDQSVVAGLGNIYADESLFAAGIHPLERAHRIAPARIDELTRQIKRVLRKALRHRGSTLRDYVDAAGGAGAFQKLHAVYDRGDLPCRKCDATIKRIVLGGRSTCFCPNCQKRGLPRGR